MEFILGTLAVAALWIFFSTRSKDKGMQAFNALDLAEPWFTGNNVVFSSVKFNAYDGPALARNPGATVLVGVGESTGGDKVGFVIEVLSQKGVLVGELLHPYGIALSDRMASMDAARYGKPMIDILLATAEARREKNRTAVD